MELDEKIKKIELDTIKMFNETLSFLNDAASLYFDKDKEIPSINDDEIDKLERNIENECLLIILKERTFASDLRKVTGIFKFCEDIERLGDHAEDLVWTITNLNKYNKGVKVESLTKMMKVSLEMASFSYKAFLNMDVILANEIINKDDMMDELYLTSLKEIPLIKEKDLLDENFIIYSTLLSKYLERIADHSVNIAEWVIYIKNGYYKDKMII